MYFLDSDTFRLFRDGHAAVTERVSRTPDSEIFLSGITVEESVKGIWTELNEIRSGNSKGSLEAAYEGMIEVIRDLTLFNMMAYPQAAEETFKELRKTSKRVGQMDLRLAAHAIVVGATVITLNAEDFGRIPGVAFEDWSR